MKSIKRYSFIFFAIVLLFSLVPFQAFAVDPVSAGVMANAFAQAIASYGAANGVAMTFDVSSTDGIGESVHELWKRFREGQQTTDDYATIAQAIFPELYYKTSTAIATAADAVAVGVHISSEYAEELDDFYNWLLSGPAEMVQVDNQYYQFSQAQIGSSASPLPVISLSSSGFSNMPFPYSDDARNTLYLAYDSSWAHCYVRSKSINYSVYAFGVPSLSFVYFVSATYNTGNVGVGYFRLSNDAYGGGGNFNTDSLDSTTGLYYGYVSDVVSYYIPTFSSLRDGLDALSEYLGNPTAYDNSVGVQAYDTSGIADFPDTADPNYDALNRAKDIPLNIPWDDTIYGDGTGTLTDAQSAAIAGDLTQALETDRTVELVEEQDIPIQPDYSDVLLPLIPINIPSFNFSLSGIWHYVRSWVTSLGAWLSMMFSVWGILPYAIVVPVYACLVIVIVLGLYKRFFM